MDKADTARLISIIVMAYPNFDRFKSSEQIEAMVNVWSEMFSEDNGALVGAAIKKHIATNQWPPSIAEIRAIMCDLVRPDIVPPDVAWSAVSDLLYAGGEHDHDNVVSKLPPLVGRVVESIGWSSLYELHREAYRGGKAGLDRVAFMDLYKPAYERARQLAMLPETLRATIERAELKYGSETKALLESATQKRREREESFAVYSHQNDFLMLASERSEIYEPNTEETE